MTSQTQSTALGSSDRPRSSAPVVFHARCISGKGGGPEKTILNSPAYLQRMGYVAHCAYLHSENDGPSILARAEKVGTSVISVLDNGALDWSLVSRLAEICERENVTIWHGHDYKTDLLGLLVRRHWPMKLVTTVHGWVEHTWRTPLYYAIDRFAIRKYDQVICVSSDLHKQCLGLGIDSERCHLVDNAIDTIEFKRTRTPTVSREAFAKTHNEPVTASKFLVGAMGRLSPEKGFLQLIESISHLRSRGLDITLWIAGEGGQKTELQQKAKELNCEQNVRLLGHVSDVKLFFESLDLFVLSSLREGLPNVVLEAMALEVPVVATEIAGLPKLITDGTNGALIAPDSVGALVQAIEQVLSDDRRRQRYALSARETIESSFSFSERMKLVDAVYQRALNG